jgi:hypothetical protein
MVRAVQAGFGGGLNTTADDLAMAENEARELTNARVDEYGTAGPRAGTQRLHASALSGAVVGGAEWNGFVYASAGGTLSRGVLTSTITWSTVGTGLSAVNLTQMRPFQRSGGQVLYIADGGRLAYTDGVTVTRLGTGPTSVTNIEVYNQRLFCTQGDFVYWSGLNNGDSLGVDAAGGGFAPVRTFTDGALVVPKPLKSSLMMWHESGISRFTGIGQDDLRIEAGVTGVTGDVGTPAPGSVVSLEDVALFLSDRGFYAATEGGVQPISAPIERSLEGLDRQLWGKVLGVHNRRQREVWFYLPSIGVFVYQYRLGKWFGPWKGGYVTPEPRIFFEATGIDGRPVVLIGDASGWVKLADAPGRWLDDVASDGTGGTPYTLSIKSRRMFANDAGLHKSFRKVRAVTNLGSAQTIQVGITSRQGRDSASIASTTKTWDSGGLWDAGGTWDGESLSTRTLNLAGNGEWCELDVQCTAPNDGPTISRLEVDGFVMSYRGQN